VSKPRSAHEPDHLQIAIVNCVWDRRAPTPSATLDRFHTLTGWAHAVRRAGASRVAVFQRFHGDTPRAVRAGSDVTFCFIGDAGPPRPRAWYAGVRLAEAVAGFGPDLVHVNGLDYPLLTRRLRRVLPPRTAIVVQDHGGFDPAGLSAIRKAWMRHGLGASDALLVATPPQRELFQTSGLVPPQLAVRDVMEGSTPWRAEARDCPTSGLSLLFVGRLNANKDPLTVLDGFARFARSCPEATLTFVYHEGDLEPQLRTVIGRDTWLGSRVRLAGAVPHEELPALYAAADFFVLGSHREGSGYAALEALACGAVPVLTDIPSFRWLTHEGRIGALWAPGNAASLSEALSRLAAAPLDGQRAAARAFFEANFSWEAIGRRALAIYRELSPT
jgi:glycosyltransferase involved in cell wall biosynthesis